MATTQDRQAPRPASRPQRADARRNYDALLAAADTAFTEHGIDTSLEDIARQAGVAIGTLYRHFPTRESLLEAVLRDELDNLRDRGQLLLDHPSPLEALITWMDTLAQHASTYRGLGNALLASFEDETSALHASHMGMRSVGSQLLTRAQEEGKVRADIDISHLLTMNCALAAAIERGPADPDHGNRLRKILYDGLMTSP